MIYTYNGDLNIQGVTTTVTMAAPTRFVVWNFKITGGATFNSNFATIGGTPLRGLLALSE